MKSSAFAVVIFLFAAINIYPQDKNSIQFSGGIISPMNSTNGLTGTVQFNYALNEITNFYIYTGYSAWDRNIVKFDVDWSPIQKKTLFTSYSKDSYVLIPFFVGRTINFNTNKIFTTFVNFEIGYSHLSYYRYKNYKVVNSSTGEVLSYEVDKSTKQKVNENLIGVGIGAGLFHPLTKNVNLILSFKLNSYFSSEYYGFFDSGVTWVNILGGFNVSI